MLKKWLLLIAVITQIAITGCKKDAATNIFMHVDISVTNSSGEDLIGSAGYQKADINVYYMRNGVPVLFYEPDYDADKGFLLFKDSRAKGAIRVMLDFSRDKNVGETRIQFGSSEPDVLKYEYSIDGNSVVLTKVWFNGSEKAQTFTIVK